MRVDRVSLNFVLLLVVWFELDDRVFFIQFFEQFWDVSADDTSYFLGSIEYGIQDIISVQCIVVCIFLMLLLDVLFFDIEVSRYYCVFQFIFQFEL